MSILYAIISRGKTVLAEYTSTTGNFPTVTRVLLSKIQSEQDGKMSYIYDQYIFHYIVENHLIYMCMTGTAFFSLHCGVLKIIDTIHSYLLLS